MPGFSGCSHLGGEALPGFCWFWWHFPAHIWSKTGATSWKQLQSSKCIDTMMIDDTAIITQQLHANNINYDYQVLTIIFCNDNQRRSIIIIPRLKKINTSLLLLLLLLLMHYNFPISPPHSIGFEYLSPRLPCSLRLPYLREIVTQHSTRELRSSSYTKPIGYMYGIYIYIYHMLPLKTTKCRSIYYVNILYLDSMGRKSLSTLFCAYFGLKCNHIRIM